MDIGRVGLWTFLLDEQPTSRVRELAQEIEEMGWPTLWRPESSGRDVLISSSVLLDATSQLNVASGIAQIYARHPVTTAAAQKTLFEAHEGRFMLGLGVAHAPSVEGVRDNLALDAPPLYRSGYAFVPSICVGRFVV